MKQEDILQKLNLSPSEAKTYLAVLNAGQIKVSEIANLIGTTKMAGYTAVQSLVRKGLLSETTKNNQKYVSAESPERLLLRLREQRNTLEERENALKSLMPDLRSLYTSSNVKPSVRVYEGIEGLKTIYEDTLKTMPSGDNYVAFGSPEAFQVLPNYLDDYISRRVKKNISFRGIAPADEATVEFIQEDKKKLRQVLLVPKNKFPFKNEIDIYADKVAILSFKDQIGLIITSKQIADTQRAIFELAWIGAKHVK